jgi:hypothetical protein
MAKSTYDNFTISAHFELSLRLTDLNITDFAAALKYIQHLPYGRNSKDGSLLRVLDEKRGTCSTKNALLHTLCMENGKQGFNLMLGIFNMDAENTPAVQPVLRKYRLPYIPEAHVYLKNNGTIIDATFAKAQTAWTKSIAVEEEIESSDIGAYKTKFHRNYLDKWRKESKDKAVQKYSLDQLWEIREECIALLTEANKGKVKA